MTDNSTLWFFEQYLTVITGFQLNSSSIALATTTHLPLAFSDTPTTEFNYYDANDSGFTVQKGLMVVIALLGIIGNLTAGHVILASRSIRRTLGSTFLLNQSIVDLATCIAALTDLATQHWVRNSSLAGFGGLAICWFIVGRFAFHACLTVSTYNMLALTGERAVSVIWPVWHRKMVTRGTVVAGVAGAWVVGIGLIAFSLPPTSDLSGGRCRNWAVFPSHVYRRLFGVADLLFNYAIPLAVIAICYYTIYAAVFSRGGVAEGAGRMATSRKNSALRTMLSIIVCYVACNSLLHLVIVVNKFGGDISWGGRLERIGVLAMFSNAAANPFIYTFQYRDYQLQLLRSSRALCGAVACCAPLLDPGESKLTPSGESPYEQRSADDNRNDNAGGKVKDIEMA